LHRAISHDHPYKERYRLRMHAAPEITTDRLRLRGWRASDLDALATLLSDPDVARFLTVEGRAVDRATSWRYLATYAGHWALNGFGPFVVEDRASGKVIGRVGPWRPEGWPGFEIGWGLARAAWGRGFAFEAAAAAGRWAFAEVCPAEIVCLIHTENARSIRLAQRLGAQPDATLWAKDPAYRLWRADRAAWAV